jgi:hypothetical protein
MITKNKTIQITDNGNFPYQYEWILNDVCISVNQLTGNVTSNNPNIFGEFTFTNSDCLDAANVQLKLTNSTGCFEIFAVNFNNACTNFDISDIQQQQPYTFSTSVIAGGTAPFTYNWTYDTDSFNLTYDGGSVISLDKIIETNQEYIYVTVTDSEGCQVSKELLAYACKPEVPNLTINTTCLEDNTRFVNFEVSPTKCPSVRFFNWSTLQLSSVTGLNYTYNYTTNTGSNIAGSAFINITIDDLTVAGNYVINYSITDTEGNTSNTGIINLIVQECATTPPIVIEAQPPFQLDCADTAGTTFDIDITDFVQATGTINWNSFSFLEDSMVVATNPIDTFLADGEALYDPVTHIITYTVPTVGGVDGFEFLICDTDGNCASSAFYAIIVDCSLPPVANDDSFCAACGEPMILDVTANDVITGVVGGLILITDASHGNIVYNITTQAYRYTADPDFTGTDSFTYTVTNTNGEVSNVATVTITVVCAGQNNSISVC